MKLEKTYFNTNCPEERSLSFKISNDCFIKNNVNPDIVFIGDTIIEGLDVTSIFSDLGVITNRGVRHDGVIDVYKRFSDDVIKMKPKICVLSVGHEEIYALDNVATSYIKKYKTYDKIFSYIDKQYFKTINYYFNHIIKECKKNKIKLVFVSAFPTTHSLSVGKDYRNYFIDNMNKFFSVKAKKCGFNYVDYASDIKNSDNQLDYKFSMDSVYLNGVALKIMTDKLRPILETLLKEKNL